MKHTDISADAVEGERKVFLLKPIKRNLLHNFLVASTNFSGISKHVGA